MRSMDWAALFVCRVEKTRWPVSAAVIAVCIVPQSRISPTMITSGSCRNMFLRASPKLGVSVDTSRWETAALPSAKRNSIGSSIVTMWTGRFSMIERMTPARVVDLPEPVGPGDQDEPLGQVDEALEDLGEVQLGDRGQLEGDPAEHGGIGAALDEDVAAEPRDPGQAVADVDGLVLLEALTLSRGQDLEQHLLEVLRLQSVCVQGDEPALDAQKGRSHRLQVEVRGLLLGHELEQFGECQCSEIIAPRAVPGPVRSASSVHLAGFSPPRSPRRRRARKAARRSGAPRGFRATG